MKCTRYFNALFNIAGSRKKRKRLFIPYSFTRLIIKYHPSFHYTMKYSIDAENRVELGTLFDCFSIKMNTEYRVIFRDGLLDVYEKLIIILN